MQKTFLQEVAQEVQILYSLYKDSLNNEATFNNDYSMRDFGAEASVPKLSPLPTDTQHKVASLFIGEHLNAGEKVPGACNLDLAYRWINCAFSLNDQEGNHDEIYIRLDKKDDITIDFTPGKDSDWLVFVDDNELRWINLESTHSINLTDRNALAIESLVRTLYLYVQNHKDTLRILLKRAIAISWEPENLSFSESGEIATMPKEIKFNLGDSVNEWG